MLLKNKIYKSERNEMLTYVPSNVRTLLDVGAGAGGFVHALRRSRPGIRIVALEPSDAFNLIDESLVDKKICGLFEASIFDEKFDCIVFNDVLEHFADPWSELRNVHALLNPGGIVLASIPNVAHFTIIVQLLFKRFDYVEFGILDKTHLRFFTKKTIARLFADTGYEVVLCQGLNSHLFIPKGFGYKLISLFIKFLALFIPSAMDYHQLQFAVIAKRVQDC